MCLIQHWNIIWEVEKQKAMERHIFTTLLFSLSLLLACNQVVDGLATKNCKHSVLADQIKQLLKCSSNNADKAVDELINIAKQGIQDPSNNKILGDLCSLAQKTAREEITCANLLAATCLEPKVARLVSDAGSIFKGGCDRYHSPLNYNNLRTWGKKVESTLGRYPANLKYLSSMITFDKRCSLRERGNAFYNGPMACISQKAITMRPHAPTSYYPTCAQFLEMLSSCSSGNDCFSQQEMDLVRDVVFSLYRVGMEHVVKVYHKFKHVPEAQTLVEQMGIKNYLTAAVKDFESKNCVSKIKSFPGKLLL